MSEEFTGIDEQLKKMLRLTPDELDKLEPATVGEQLAKQMLLEAFEGENSWQAMKTVVERVSGRVRNIDPPASEDSELVTLLKDIGYKV